METANRRLTLGHPRHKQSFAFYSLWSKGNVGKWTSSTSLTSLFIWLKLQLWQAENNGSPRPRAQLYLESSLRSQLHQDPLENQQSSVRHLKTQYRKISVLLPLGQRQTLGLPACAERTLSEHCIHAGARTGVCYCVVTAFRRKQGEGWRGSRLAITW